ncbi:hypothetical protein WH52_05125 [Tenacibaculum holothuriorum]|uniref:SPOR domain-containing protein n=1 Tax=Tenacibaculum holothuriorum TaxID=1635173 RepID=A0A1Y2PEX4_9FLAO|nr:SPOR domain-containing protein [Tenacibaculum holothuriorum]OSY89044.1 hypothetical protein WH52_05125 [Tenacibaculum holothuriorum]
MTIANYINDLLYRYDCVIIPNFGGFVTNKTGAKVNHFTHTMHPPKKEITFNSYLQHNDGLLANYIATNEKISFEEAVRKIAVEVAEWKEELTKTSIEVAQVGTLSMNEDQQITFEPNLESNFLTDSFGLATVESPAVGRIVEENEVTVVDNAEEKETKVLPLYVKRAAAAVVVLGLGITGWNYTQNQQEAKEFATQQEAIDKKIQSATFVIDNPLPTINLNVAKEANNFFIIAGAFQSEANATKKLEQLKEEGFDAKIVGKNSIGLTQVAFSGYATREDARTALEEIQNTVSEDAWLLEK